MKKLLLLSAILISLISVHAFAPAAGWQITDKYNIRFTGSGDVGGIFKTFKGVVLFDEKNLSASNFDISIDVASINTGNGLMNTHAKSADWFDAAKYPVIRFTSKKIVKGGNGYQVTGDLDIHGVKKEMTIPFTFQNKGTSATFNGQFVVNRNDFHIGKPGGEVDANVKLDVMVPVVKKSTT